MKPLRVVAYLWAAPATALGLMCVPLALIGGGKVRVVDGVLEAQGGLLRRLLGSGLPVVRTAAAMTLGHVVIAQDAACLVATRRHERVHVRQYERWGAFFIPAYLLASGSAWLRRRHPYLDNPFEREAFRNE